MRSPPCLCPIDSHHRCAMPQEMTWQGTANRPAHFELYGRQCEARPTPLLFCEYPLEPAVDTRKSSILLPCIQHEPARVRDSRSRAPSHKWFLLSKSGVCLFLALLLFLYSLAAKHSPPTSLEPATISCFSFLSSALLSRVLVPPPIGRRKRPPSRGEQHG